MGWIWIGAPFQFFEFPGWHDHQCTKSIKIQSLDGNYPKKKRTVGLKGLCWNGPSFSDIHQFSRTVTFVGVALQLRRNFGKKNIPDDSRPKTPGEILCSQQFFWNCHQDANHKEWRYSSLPSGCFIFGLNANKYGVGQNHGTNEGRKKRGLHQGSQGGFYINLWVSNLISDQQRIWHLWKPPGCTDQTCLLSLHHVTWR